MRRTLLFPLALALLFTASLTQATNASTAVETEATLRDKMLTDADLATALRLWGSRMQPTRLAESVLNDTGNVGVARSWESGNQFLVMMLWAPREGRALAESVRSEVLTSNYVARVLANSIVHCDYAGEIGSLLSKDDAAYAWHCQLNGGTYEVVTISFVKGNITAMTLSGIPEYNDGLEAWVAFTTQIDKLP